IRLLDIQPGQGEDIIHIGLCTYPLDCAPSYVALSYTWGDANHTSAILCQGQTLFVTRNLKEALWQLRESHDIFAGRACARSDRNKSPYFWIDAVCINQNDDEEKNQQVKLMWEIYSRAAFVIVWLGKQDEFTKSETLGLPGFISQGWDHLFSVLSRPWFSRVWVIQELVAAK
ncbi:heterokaryon incompatibility, partial [Leptodontidium sp. 2 PMI_412]